MDDAEWFRPSSGRLLLDVKAIPGSSRSGIAGLRDGALLVRIAAPPERGKANDELRSILARELGLSRSEVVFVSGAASRRKRLSLPMSAEGALRRLAGESHDPVKPGRHPTR
jgi:uncharacterized protein (TIGR00251 family)